MAPEIGTEAFTVTVLVVAHPPDTAKVILTADVVPIAAPVTIPVELTVATRVLPLLQTPPPTVLLYSANV